ncbi:hypothetical protein CON34_06660 [Bacillus thuringiensis]|uniref:DUF3626 domain-containing protein n=1 Tax=Bacillus thuringiensis TaxID=1428 RepID=UPI000BEB5132|nr:DUF3626 domain-containing protein [Bacillus thuringiensis]MED3444325.1 DUF3626 domain-containing protein [Bacillus thuringiensis]MED4444756.1 DUF3626 domain-containing protein [Bacillus cereus]PEB44387.1 hypothetical protein COM82_28730 [Bacillus thuringiensis]PED27230.1 hypothetical protein CON34_06660 [Bacillus thuringiensis]
MELSRSQLLALEYISKYAENEKREAKATINHILKMSNITDEIFEEAVANLKSHARIALHFHPDRLDSSMKSVAEALFEQGVYKSQFETLLSNGSVSAYPGGERDLWEKRIFGGAYQLEGVTNEQRPKYGALNLMLHPDGPAPRFGSCYFLLSPKVSSRSTYTYLDSHQDPKEKGTYEEFDMILAALLEETFVRDFAIGKGKLTPTILINHLLANLKRPFIDLVSKEPARNLNHYIEAQIHGEISLKEDVEVLVADPSFKGTDVGRVLEEICLKYAIDLYWHIGFVLMVDEVPMDFRGSKMPSLARRIERNHCIDANIIGSAVVDLKRNPLSWSDRGTYEEVLQELKLLWHVLVRFGKPNRK